MLRIIVVLFLLFEYGYLFAKSVSLAAAARPIFAKKANEKSSHSQFQQSRPSNDRISLNFQEIKVRAVLQILAEFTGINMVVSDKVSGSITLRLIDVPWKEALSIILTTRSLSKRIIGNVMLIAPAEEIIDREKKEFIVQSDLGNLVPLHSDLLQINYAKAQDIAAMLKEQNSTLLSTRGSLTVDNRTNKIWIQDSEKQVVKIKELIKNLDVPAKQILIEARIVNVTKEVAKDLGARFGVSAPNHLVGRLRRNDLLKRETITDDTLPLIERLNFDLAAAPLSGSPATVGIALAKLGNGIFLDLELSALESEGKGEIISTPRLITTNQQTAVIESGEEVPYQESTSSGATATAFKKAVLSLKVTPQITSDSQILMDLDISQDLPSPRVFNGVPSIITKELHTEVQVNNEQTIVLGGIYKQDKHNGLNRVPVLGELPIVGGLFRNRSAVERNEELLIFITPRIITSNLSETSNKRTRQAFIGNIELDKFGKSVELAH